MLAKKLTTIRKSKCLSDMDAGLMLTANAEIAGIGSYEVNSACDFLRRSRVKWLGEKHWKRINLQYTN